ncbi:MAG TPA: zinc finger Ran-binding domain-containing protein [Pyrinomonadaceae bacterium]|jgi:hypothetical protein
MNNHWCTVCGHVNRVGAVACEMCDTRLDAPAGAGDADPSRETFGENAGETYGENFRETSGASSGSGYAGYGAAGEGYGAAGGARRDGSLPTDIPSPQFKGAGDVISPTLEVYRKHFPLVGLLVVVTTLPLVFLQYTLYAAINSSELESGDGSGGVSVVAGGGFMGSTILYWLLTMLGYAVLSGALAYAVVQIQRTGAARAGESLVWGLRKMAKVVAVTLISYLLIYGLPALLLGVAAAALGPVVLIVFLLMLLPWIVLVLTFSMAVPAAAIENRGVIESMTRSAELTKGHKGLIFLTYFLWWVVIILLNLVTTWSFYFSGDGGVPEHSLVQLLVQMLVGGILNSSMFVLTVYIFLGLLNEHRQGFSTNAFTPGPAAAAR